MIVPTSVVHLHKQSYDVLVDRSTPWGNPFTHIRDRHTLARFVVSTRSESITSFAIWAYESDDPEAAWIREHVHELQGKTLACWCMPKHCHGEVLAEMADRTVPGEIVPKRSRQEQIRFPL